ncbi:MAG: SGNH/GDSL hydrolase family protein [Phycisphaerae bacterium]
MSDIGKLDASMAVGKAEGGLVWFDIKALGVEGRGWPDTERFYDRLPARAKAVVRPPVWELSRHSAGMCARFITDSTSISARWSLLSPSLAMNHMPATGVSGLDLYARTGSLAASRRRALADSDAQAGEQGESGDSQGGAWRWFGVGRPDSQLMSAALVEGLDGRAREYVLYLPLYNGVESVEVGVKPGAKLTPAAPRRHKPIIFYGTSIVQGGCASRPGMVYTAILGRRLDRPTINLGFSGNGKMEPEVAALLAELDACAFVLDPLPNMQASEVAERMPHAVRTIRAARPAVPIVLVEDRTFSSAPFLRARREEHDARRAALRAAHQALVAEGVRGLHYVEGPPLLGDDGDGTVDGSHPTDLGFVRMADALEPVLRPIV